MTCNYENKSSGYQRNTNRLRSVDDAVATTAQTDDIEDQQEDKYRYDATGNLIYDRSEEIERIEWTVSGKVLKVTRTTTSTKPNLEFTYDASGNRIAKKVIEKNGDYKTTFYVRDASGNVMAVYKTSGTTNLSLEEQHIYGSSRLGIFKKDKTVRNKARALGERRYELTDHLGNVRVVLSDYKKAESIVLSATDYYPFGMVARTYTSPEEYRYGFNGQERETELDESTTSAEYWMYDGRLGRRWNVDPVVKYWESGYATFFNNPICINDLKGLNGKNTNQKVGERPQDQKVIKTPDGGYINVPSSATVEYFTPVQKAQEQLKFKGTIDLSSKGMPEWYTPSPESIKSFTVNGVRFTAKFENYKFVGYFNDKNQQYQPSPILYEEKVTPDFKQKLLEISYRLGHDPNKIMAVIRREAGPTFKANAENGTGAVGLIQFTDDAVSQINKVYGTNYTDDILLKMTEVEQLEVVYKYFNMYKTKSFKNIEDYAMATIWPAAMGRSLDSVIWTEGDPGYSGHKSIDADKDGKITVKEIGVVYSQYYVVK